MYANIAGMREFELCVKHREYPGANEMKSGIRFGIMRPWKKEKRGKESANGYRIP